MIKFRFEGFVQEIFCYHIFFCLLAHHFQMAYNEMVLMFRDLHVTSKERIGGSAMSLAHCRSHPHFYGSKVLYGLAIVNPARGISWKLLSRNQQMVFHPDQSESHTAEIHWETILIQIVSKQSSRDPSRTSTPMWLCLGLQDVRKESTLIR